MISLQQLELDSFVQSRVKFDSATIGEYCSAYLAGAAFPKITVFFDGAAYHVADGFHRCQAAKKAGREQIDADVQNGSRRDAIVVCFSDTNLVFVAGLKTMGRRFVFADNDVSGAGLRTAEATGLPFAMSPIAGEDAKDLHVRAGLLAVSDLIRSVRAHEVLSK